MIMPLLFHDCDAAESTHMLRTFVLTSGAHDHASALPTPQKTNFRLCLIVPPPPRSRNVDFALGGKTANAEMSCSRWFNIASEGRGPRKNKPKRKLVFWGVDDFHAL